MLDGKRFDCIVLILKSRKDISRNVLGLLTISRRTWKLDLTEGKPPNLLAGCIRKSGSHSSS